MTSKPLGDNKMRASADFVKDSRILLAVILAQSRTTSGRESLRVCLDGVGLQEDPTHCEWLHSLDLGHGLSPSGESVCVHLLLLTVSAV